MGLIAIVEMCEKCSHFRLMLAVEEMEIAQPETCEKYFVYYKENFERSSAVVCLNEEFYFRVRSIVCLFF